MEDATLCTNCGKSLSEPIRERRNWEDEIEIRAEEFGERAERFGRRMESRHLEDECYGGRDRSTGPIIFGSIIILVGLSSLLGKTYTWARIGNLWPVILIGIGLLTVSNTLRRR